MVLTAKEVEWAETAFYQGPAALVAAGLNRDAIAKFVDRRDVQEHFLFLKREYDIHEGLRRRAKFVATRNMHALVSPATAVIAAALAGPDYARDNNGHILKDGAGNKVLNHAEMTPLQLKAATFIMESVGVGDYRLQGDAASDPPMKLLFASTTKDASVVEDDPLLTTEVERAQSRELIRAVISRMAPRVIEAHAKVRQGLGLTTEPKPKKKRKKTQPEKRRAAKEK